MLIKMKRSMPGSEDGIKVLKFLKGIEYDTTDRLAEVFVQNKTAEYVKAESIETEEEKVVRLAGEKAEKKRVKEEKKAEEKEKKDEEKK